MSFKSADIRLRGCMTCGEVVHQNREADMNEILRCPSCHAKFGRAQVAGARLVRQRTMACAITALILYPWAIVLPILKIDRLGSIHESGVLKGSIELLQDGHRVLGLLVILCSVVLPIAKLLGLILLCITRFPVGPRYRGFVWKCLELTGRWGMLDVLLVAVLVAFVKLGDYVSIEPGPGVILFSAVVVLSLVSAMLFDPRAIRMNSMES
mgnify:CR=1 FL=1